MSLWVYSLCHSNRLTSITLSGKIVKPDIKAGSKFHPYCQFSRVIISLNAKSLACNWFNCIFLQLPPMPSTAQPALGWQFLEHPQVSPARRDQHRLLVQVILLPVPRIWPYDLGTENYLPLWPFLSPGQLRWLLEMTFALNCSGFVSFKQPDRQNLKSHRPLRNTAERTHGAPLTKKKTITRCSYHKTSPAYAIASFPAL